MCSEFLHCAARDQTQSLVYAREGSTTRSYPFNLEFCWRAQCHKSRPLVSTPWMCECICGLTSAWVWAICSLGFHWVSPHKLFWLPQAVPWPRALGPGWKLLENCPALTGVLPQSLFLLRMSAWASCPMGNFSCTADLQEPATFLTRTSTCVWRSYHSNYDALKGWRWDFVSGAQSLAHLPLLRWWSLNDLLVKSGIFICWFWHHGHLPVISICPGRERSRAWYKQIPEIPVFERKTEDQEFKTILNNIKGQPGVHETLSHNIKQTNRRQTKTKFYSK